MEKEKKIPVRINEVIKASIQRFGKEGDPIFIYKNFVIFLKSKEKITVRINEIIKVRVTKILPSFAIAEMVK